MGDPKKSTKRYSKPLHPWKKARIEEESALMKKYGLKNKKEIWKAASLLQTFKRQAKKLAYLQTIQAEKEKKQLMSRVQKLGFISSDAKIEDILGLGTQNVLERRLQTFLVKLGIAKTIKQARQFISHHHIYVNKKKITSPSFIVSRTEEPSISFSVFSKFASEDHPERQKKMPAGKKETKENKKEERNEKNQK